MSNHLVNHITCPELKTDNILHVIGVVSNPVRWHSRYRLAREWCAAMNATPHVKLHLVEAAFGDRHHELRGCAESYLPLRTNSHAWIKESMIDLGARHLLPRDWRYMAWIDADVFFRNPHWAQETLHQLQHHAVIQPWTDCVDLGPLGGILQHFRSFGYQHQKRMPKQMHPSQPYQYAHTGFAWACRREFWEAVQGLPDYCILGSADHHAAFAMIGEVNNTIHKGMAKSFFRRLNEWQANAVRMTHKEVGFAPGRIEHMWHGSKKKRKYRERWDILIKDHYDPDLNITHDAAGVVQLINNPRLEHDILLYNRERCEDSIDEF